jgi:hypothetical protein
MLSIIHTCTDRNYFCHLLIENIQALPPPPLPSLITFPPKFLNNSLTTPGTRKLLHLWSYRGAVSSPPHKTSHHIQLSDIMLIIPLKLLSIWTKFRHHKIYHQLIYCYKQNIHSVRDQSRQKSLVITEILL